MRFRFVHLVGITLFTILMVGQIAWGSDLDSAARLLPPASKGLPGEHKLVSSTARYVDYTGREDNTVSGWGGLFFTGYGMDGGLPAEPHEPRVQRVDPRQPLLAGGAVVHVLAEPGLGLPLGRIEKVPELLLGNVARLGHAPSSMRLRSSTRPSWSRDLTRGSSMPSTSAISLRLSPS